MSMVWVLKTVSGCYDCGGDEVLGVYSSEELAVQARAKVRADAYQHEPEIEAFEVDQ